MDLAELRTRRCVIFDLFHTLSTIHHAGIPGPDTSELLGVSREAYLRALFDDTELRLTGRISDPVEIIRNIAEGCRAPVPASEYPRIARLRQERFAASLRRIRPSVLSALDLLRSRGKTLALISNADILEASGWDASPLAERFSVTVFSCHVGMAKPDPAIFHHCLDRLDASPGDALFVGDGGSNEFAGAAEAGIPSVCTVEFLRDTSPEKVEERRAGADLSVESLEELARGLVDWQPDGAPELKTN